MSSQHISFHPWLTGYVDGNAAGSNWIFRHQLTESLFSFFATKLTTCVVEMKNNLLLYLFFQYLFIKFLKPFSFSKAYPVCSLTESSQWQRLRLHFRLICPALSFCCTIWSLRNEWWLCAQRQCHISSGIKIDWCHQLQKLLCPIPWRWVTQHQEHTLKIIMMQRAGSLFQNYHVDCNFKVEKP